MTAAAATTGRARSPGSSTLVRGYYRIALTVLLAGLVLAVITSAPAPAVADPEQPTRGFIPIEPLAGHSTNDTRGVSADGSVVVGTSGSGQDQRAYVWTNATGSVPLPTPSGRSRAEDVSADGRTVVGFAGGEGVRWVDGELEVLSVADDIPFVYPVGVSADGAVITGEGEQDGQLIAFRWTPDELINIGALTPSDFEVLGTAVSDDGNVIVGLSEGDTAEAFRWTAAAGMQGLGFLPGHGSFSTATSVSEDGCVIGGQSDVGSDGWAAVRWTAATGWVEIPSIIPSEFVANSVRGMSGSGDVMVGYNTGLEPTDRQMFIWEPQRGARNLQDALEAEFGIDLMGWNLDDTGGSLDRGVRDVSTSGNAIIGSSVNPDAEAPWGWIAYVGIAEPDPVTLRYCGHTSGVRGETVTLVARLSSEDGPVHGQTIVFALEGQDLEATTDQEGVAVVDMTIDQPYGSHDLQVNFAGDDRIQAAEATAPFSVLWEHRFVDDDRELRVNTITRDLQFGAPGDVSEVKTDPDMRVETLPTGEAVIEIDYTDEELSVTGRFFPDEQRFVAVVRTAAGLYVLTALP